MMIANRSSARLATTGRLALAAARAPAARAETLSAGATHARAWSSCASSNSNGNANGVGVGARSLESRPIYSLTSARHLANTTTGTFAPTTAERQRQQRSRQLSILDTSDHLPSLPVPNLNETLERLKETIWPMAMNSSEFANALELIEAFAGSPGQKLDLLLRAKASQTKNWLTHDWWIQEAYLRSRAPLPINSNPAMIYPELPFEVADQRRLIGTTAQLISGVIEFKLALLRGYNPEWADHKRKREHEHEHEHDNNQEHASGEFNLDPNLCYNQYRNIFGSTRLPGEHMDTVELRSLDEHADSFNLVLAHRGHFFEVQLDGVGQAARIETLESVLSKIIDHSAAAEGPTGLGILTADRRDRWAQSMRLLDGDSLRALRDAQLVVCLDTVPAEPEDKYLRHLLGTSAGSVVGDADSDGASASASAESLRLEALSRQVLHSDRTNVGNRWFDKTLQLIVVTDEASQRFLGAGINYEHSVAEAMVVTKLIEFSYDKCVQQNRATTSGGGGGGNASGQSAPIARYRRLKMAGSNGDGDEGELGARVERARQDFVAQLDQFDLAYFKYTQYGAAAIKSWRFSPDSWLQVALQLAHYQLHKRLGPCYESASTRQFAYGRTETIRSLTKDVGQFCLEPSFETIQAAIVSHKSYANAANSAAAIDRVLLAYKLIFNELKANAWAWGLPTFSSPARTEGPRLRFHSLEDTKPEQQVALDDLFTEQELNVLSAFFNNELIERSKKFALSTSQVTSAKHANICMSYGPQLADGYGCCYNMGADQIVAAITANSSNQSFSCEVDKFSESLAEALDRMRSIVAEGSQQRRQQQQQQQQQQRSESSNS